MADLDLRRYGAADVPLVRDELLDVHADANADLLRDPFYTVQRFADRLDRYLRDPTFTLVAGHLDGQLLGYTFGSTLPAETRWWQGLLDAEDADMSRETGSRTFALREIMVRRAYRRRGYGRKLHDGLLRDRPEERATLFVRPDNPAKRLYLRWGWRIVGRLQPFADSPVFDSMLRDLRC